MAGDYARQFYASKAWKRTQAAYMTSKNYVCERCGSPARIVHHKRHITPNNISNPEITLDWNNLEAVCFDCHNNQHFKRSSCINGLTFDQDGNVIKMANVFLICGAPGSGKTTYVKQVKQHGDLVVDLDLINAALLGELDNIYADHSTVLPITFEVRDTIYKCINSHVGTWRHAYVITSQPDAWEVNRLAQQLNAEIHYMGTAKDECIDRIMRDSRRGNKDLYVGLVEKWFDKNSG